MKAAWRRLLFCSLVACVAAPAWGDDAAPLTLAAALAAADSAHPDVEAARADVEAARADQRTAGARDDLTVNLDGVLQTGRPTTGGDFRSDNALRLSARKTLYDFGRTTYAEDAAESALQAQQAKLLDVRDRRRIAIMSRFFDVLLADMQYNADNEYMAVAYVNFDHARDRHQVGQISSVDLADLEAKYQEVLVKRNADGQRQRITRALLANAMNQPGKLASDLAEPDLAGNNRTLPGYDSLVKTMLAHNTLLKAQQDLLAAAQQRLEALRAGKAPVLDAVAEAGTYSRDALTRNRVSAGLALSWPLYQGDRVDAQVAKELAYFHGLQASAAKLKMDLTQSLLENYLEIEQLRGTERPAAQKVVAFRNMDLERKRGEYEVELKTDLGNSMADLAQAKIRQKQVEFRLALAFARLEALLGEPLDKATGTQDQSNQKAAGGQS